MAPRGVPWTPRGVPWPLYEEYALEDPYYLYYTTILGGSHSEKFGANQNGAVVVLGADWIFRPALVN